MTANEETAVIKYCIIKNGGHYFKSLNDEYRNNPEIALFAIQNNPNLYIMEKADINIRDNKEIALLELKNNGRAIGFLSDRLKADKEVAMMACNSFGEGLKYLSSELKQDEDVVCKAVGNDAFSIFQADSSMLSNKAVLNIAFKTYEKNANYYNTANSEDQVEFFISHKNKYELSVKLENELPKHDFKSNIELLDKSKLDTIIAESRNSFKESEAKSNVVSIAEVKNEIVAEVQETQLANAPVRPQRRLKL